ncbi:RF-1 domain-containing protein, partial [Epithele typhae]|uniref:RF-1 domain-containing protein n=1 Tax=Epithele typhae TaxID=378194 RepID=UPI002007AF03
MSSSKALLASARSAYRSALRASATTFAGDHVVRTAFRLKIRNEMLPYETTTVDEAQFAEKVALVRDVADVLRKNVVQARRLDGAQTEEGQEKWALNITEHTELGSNDTIKQPKTMAKGPVLPIMTSADDSTPPTPSANASPRPLYYSQLKKASKQRVIPELKEADLEESFVRGSGPGGQSVNKTENNVQLLHKPTGLRVSCQQTRSLLENRKIGRKILLNKLDALYNPGISKTDLQQAKQAEQERRRRKKAKAK